MIRPDWWQRAGVLIAGGALLVTLLSGVLGGAIWAIDHRIADQLAPVKADLVQIKTALGISVSHPVAQRGPGG